MIGCFCLYFVCGMVWLWCGVVCGIMVCGVVQCSGDVCGVCSSNGTYYRSLKGSSTAVLEIIRTLVSSGGKMSFNTQNTHRTRTQ